MRTSRGIARIVIGLLFCFCGRDISRAGEVQPNIVAQIMEIDGGGVEDLTIVRAGVKLKPQKFEPLYPADLVYVDRANVVATLEFDVDQVEKVDRASSPFFVPSTNRSFWSFGGLKKLFALFPAVLQPPQHIDVQQTAPSPWRGSSLSFNPLLSPAVTQVLASGKSVHIPVVWTGGRADVLLVDAAGSVIAKAPGKEPGFGLLFLPSLDAGDYTLQVLGMKGEKALNCKVHVADDSGHDALAGEAKTLYAAERLKSAPEGHLQAMIDIFDMSKSDYMAFAMVRHLGLVAP